MSRDRTNISDKLLNLIEQKHNPCIIGLDPVIDQIPACIKRKKKDYDSPFKAVRHTIIEFNRLIIDAVKDIVPAVKLQMAFYEQYGSQGVKAFEETVIYAKEKGLIVIEDAKRNDIASTAYNREPYRSKYRPEEFYLASREAAIDMREKIIKVLKQHGKLPAW